MIFAFDFFFQIREEMELENLAKMYLADLIKKECWDNMIVKGRGIGVSLLYYIEIFLTFLM